MGLLGGCWKIASIDLVQGGPGRIFLPGPGYGRFWLRGDLAGFSCRVRGRGAQNFGLGGLRRIFLLGPGKGRFLLRGDPAGFSCRVRRRGDFGWRHVDNFHVSGGFWETVGKLPQLTWLRGTRQDFSARSWVGEILTGDTWIISTHLGAFGRLLNYCLN